MIRPATINDNYLRDSAIMLTAATNADAAEQADAAMPLAVARAVVKSIAPPKRRVIRHGGLLGVVERDGESATCEIDLGALLPAGAVSEPAILAMRFSSEKFTDREAAAFEYATNLILALESMVTNVSRAAEDWRIQPRRGSAFNEGSEGQD